MPLGRHGKLLAGLGLLCGACATGSGCQTLQLTSQTSGLRAVSHVVAAPAAPLAPRSLVAWSIESAESQPSRIMSGQDQVGPDGTLCLGPYGSVQVAGLTPNQARGAIERHAANFVRQPRATVTALPSEYAVAGDQVVRTSTDLPPVLTQAPVLSRAATAEVVRTGDSRSRAVIASNWRSSERTTAGAPGLLQPAEWTVARQKDDKPVLPKLGEKPADKPMPDLPVEQLGQPNVLTPPDGKVPLPAVTIMAPVVMGSHGPGVPKEMAKVALPPYVIEPPDILLVEYPPSEGLSKDFPITGQHLVRPDGTVSLGVYGSAQVAGLTIEQAREVIAQQIKKRLNIDIMNLNVDVIAYNSKFFYVITDGGGYGEQVYPVPVTGSDTVLDALGKINGLPPASSKKHIWVARRSPGDPGGQKVLPVDWIAITQQGSTLTNYQLMPGDRLYVRADKLIRIDSGLAKFLSPIERVLGVTLLGSQAVNTIRTNPNRFNNNNNNN